MNTITQTMRFRQALIKYSFKYGVSFSCYGRKGTLIRKIIYDIESESFSRLMFSRNEVNLFIETLFTGWTNISSFIKNYIGELSKGGNIFNILLSVIVDFIYFFSATRTSMSFSGQLDTNIDRSFILLNIF